VTLPAPKCLLPPPGWECTRRPGHEGPCAAVPVAKPGEFAWVIERGDSASDRPWYWMGGDQWTENNLLAVRFSREIDARQASVFLQKLDWRDHRIVEHGWIS